jgi:DNA-binding SARP family transcriptional activator
VVSPDSAASFDDYLRTMCEGSLHEHQTGLLMDRLQRAVSRLTEPSPTGPEGKDPVRIRTLGAFEVVRDGQAVRLAEWQSRKARDLLKVLIARRGRPTPRECLMEALWPDEDPQKLSNRLSVALSTVRSVLDPEGASEPERYVAADKETIALNLNHLIVDVEVFVASADSALSRLRRSGPDGAREILELAESAYAGDFLEENLYDDWAVALREEARALYLAVTRTLAHLCGKAGEDDAAVVYWLRVLELDGYDEESHLELVALLDRGGRRGEARRRYDLYAARMAELDVEPAPFPALDPTMAASA